MGKDTVTLLIHEYEIIQITENGLIIKDLKNNVKRKLQKIEK